jgi:predicted TIM-barrel fold metal-dependent hydrolase
MLVKIPENDHGYRIFDGHAHLPPAPSKREDGTYDIEWDIAFRRNLMQRGGITAAIAMASNMYERPNGIADTRRQNDFAAWYRDSHPAEFPVALGTVEPNHGVDVNIAELNRMKDELRLDGVIWHHYFSGSTMDEPRMVTLCRELARLGLPAFLHVSVEGPHEDPFRFGLLAERVPETTLVAVGGMSSSPRVLEMRQIMKRCPNVYMDTSLIQPMGQPAVALSEEFGSQRILFGTDLTILGKGERLWSYPPGLVDILDSPRITEEDRQNILWNTAASLFPRLSALE